MLLESDLSRALSRMPKPTAAPTTTSSTSDPEALQLKIEELEDQIDATENALKEANDRMRYLEVQVEQNERKAVALENERAGLKVQVDDMQRKYQHVKGELDEVLKQIEDA